MTRGRLGVLFVLLRYPEQQQGSRREFNAQLETALSRRTLLFQYLLQQNRSLTKEDKTIAGASECKKYGGMALLTDLALFELIMFVKVMFGPVMSLVFPDVQVKA